MADGPGAPAHLTGGQGDLPWAGAEGPRTGEGERQGGGPNVQARRPALQGAARCRGILQPPVLPPGLVEDQVLPCNGSPKLI